MATHDDHIGIKYMSMTLIADKLEALNGRLAGMRRAEPERVVGALRDLVHAVQAMQMHLQQALRAPADSLTGQLASGAQARIVLADIVQDWGRAIDTDAPINGTDAVDYLVQLVERARRVL